MDLKEFLISVGRFSKEVENPIEGKNESQEQPPDSNEEAGHQQVGEIFDYYKRLGYTKLPDNVQINIPHFPGQLLKSEQYKQN